MNQVIIREFGSAAGPGAHILHLAGQSPKDCVGCWSCWIKTPGRCVHHDLDDFYRAFLSADKAVFYLKASQGFVSARVKTLFDRMIPHYLPYIRYQTGESMHEKRYDRYPEAEVYYTGDFPDEEERGCFEDYLRRVFYQFHMPAASILWVADEEGGDLA